MDTVWGTPVRWGENTFSIPIKRSLFDAHFYRVFAALYDFADFAGVDRTSITRDMEAARARIYELANMAVVDRHPNVPAELLWGPMRDYMEGLITAEAAAQRMQNSVALWLIE